MLTWCCEESQIHDWVFNDGKDWTAVIWYEWSLNGCTHCDLWDLLFRVVPLREFCHLDLVVVA